MIHPRDILLGAQAQTGSLPVCDNYSVLIVLDAAKDVPGAVRPTTTGPSVKEQR